MSVALTSDGKWVLSGSKDRGVEVWNKDTKEVQCVLRGHKNSGAFIYTASHALLHSHKETVIAIGANPTGNMFVTGSGDNLAKICGCSSETTPLPSLNFFIGSYSLLPSSGS